MKVNQSDIIKKLGLKYEKKIFIYRNIEILIAIKEDIATENFNEKLEQELNISFDKFKNKLAKIIDKILIEDEFYDSTNIVRLEKEQLLILFKIYKTAKISKVIILDIERNAKNLITEENINKWILKKCEIELSDNEHTYLEEGEYDFINFYSENGELTSDGINILFL